MAGADVEEKIDQLLNFGVDLLDRNELKQLLAVRKAARAP